MAMRPDNTQKGSKAKPDNIKPDWKNIFCKFIEGMEENWSFLLKEL